MQDTSSTQNKTENSKFHLFNFVTSQSIPNNFQQERDKNKSFTTMINTSNKQHKTGKPKGSSAKCLLKILITGKLKRFVFGGENMWFRMQKKKKEKKKKMQVAFS